MEDQHERDSRRDGDAAVPLRRTVVDWVFAGILRGDLAAGAHLVLNQVADRLGISVAPVREAVVALESLGLVTSRHNCGATVNPFGIKQMRDIYQVWHVLSLEVYRSGCGCVDQDVLLALRSDMRSLWTERDGQGWSEKETALDRRLKEAIGDGCKCRRLVEESNRYQELIDGIRAVFGGELEHQRTALREHIEIVEALLNGDANIVTALVARHNFWCMKTLMDAFRDRAGRTDEPTDTPITLES